MLEQAGRREQIEVHGVPMSRGIDPWRDLLGLVRLRRLLRSIRPDIVHSHTPKAFLLGTIAARLVGVPVVMLSIFGLPQMTKTGFKRPGCSTVRPGSHVDWPIASGAHGVSMRDYLVWRRSHVRSRQSGRARRGKLERR